MSNQTSETKQTKCTTTRPDMILKTLSTTKYLGVIIDVILEDDPSMETLVEKVYKEHVKRQNKKGQAKRLLRSSCVKRLRSRTIKIGI